MVANLDQQPVHLRAANFLVRHFAAAMENHGAHFVAFAEKPDDLILANLIIVFGGGRPELYFLELRSAAAFALLMGLLVLLVKKFAVIGDLANRRIRGWRDFHQVKPPLARQFHCFERLHDAELPAVFIDDPDLARSNPLVDADTITLPEIAFCDIPP